MRARASADPRKGRSSILGLAALWLCVFSSTGPISSAPAAALSPSLQARLDESGPNDELPIIVTLTGGVDLHDFDLENPRTRRRSMIRALKDRAGAMHKPFARFLSARGARAIRSLWSINSVAMVANERTIRDILDHGWVSDVRYDAPVSLPSASPGIAAAPEWNLTAVGAPELWSLGITGAGTVVANMDTGVDPDHPDLASRWRGGTNSWFDPNGEHSTPFDSHGHGTQTMGVMVGGDAGGTAIGVAPDATWIAVKMFSDAGSASLSVIHAGFQWLLDPDENPATDDAPDVVNGSWGFASLVNQCYDEFEADMALLKASGVGVVLSAGNLGPAFFTSESPANNPSGFATGAVDDALNVAGFSSRGPSPCDVDQNAVYPEVVAPGVNVRSAHLTFAGVIPLSYANVTGTSFAAPHVAGGMALLRSAFPDASVAELEEALISSALDLEGAGPDHTAGHGLIDLLGAYQLLQGTTGCTDSDGDGFAVEGFDCGPVDCDDTDPSVNPVSCNPVGTILADAKTESRHENRNFGSDTELQVDASSEKNTFMKLQVSGAWGTVTSATLELTVADASSADSDSSGRLQRITDCSWDEDTVTFANQPDLDGVPGPDVGPLDRGDIVSFDVTPHIQGNGTVCIALTSDSSNSVKYNSREAGADVPRLLVTADCACEPPTTTSSTSSTSSTTTSTTTSTVPTTTTSTTTSTVPTTTTSTTTSTVPTATTSSTTSTTTTAAPTTSTTTTTSTNPTTTTSSTTSTTTTTTSTSTTTTSLPPTEVQIRVSVGSDDAEERESGAMYLDSSDLELVFDKGIQKVGLRFTDVPLPANATVDEAYVQFTTDETPSDGTDLTVRGEASSDAATFTGNALDITNRPRTSAQVSWQPAAWPNVGEAGTAQQTPDVKDVIQEIIEGSGWQSGNALVLIVEGSGERVAESYDGEPNSAPLLVLRYHVGQTATTTTLATSTTTTSSTTTSTTSTSTTTTSTTTSSSTTNPPTSTTSTAPTTTTSVAPTTTSSSTTTSTSSSTTTSTTAPPTTPVTLWVPVNASEDDAEEKANGGMILHSSDLEMVYDKNQQKIGMRFNGVDVPKSAIVTQAYVQFTVDENATGPTSLTVRGQLHPNPATFTDTDNDISDRTPTSASVIYSPVGWPNVGDAGADQQTPNIKDVIQEIVDQGTWASGNSIVILVTGDTTDKGSSRIAESFDGSGSKAPVLHVTYLAAP